MASKIKTKWICQNCGYETASYLGRCPDCSQFSTFCEEIISKDSSNKTNNMQSFPVSSIKEIEVDEKTRILTNFEELDRVLGGGFVQGSLVLLAGDPGIGKSTLVLQSCEKICTQNKKVLYICAEESTTQVKLRAQRLGVNSDNLYVTAQNCLDEVVKQIDEVKPDFVIVDSIQAVYCSEIMSSSGSVSQIRECTNLLMRQAKNKNITTIIIGHVTKEGNIAGPRVLEHMVDCVINFEGDKYKTYRLLRSIKNRFGSTNEVGVFNMEESGLVEIKNPSELFLRDKELEATSGTTVIATVEGTRVLLLEVQALVANTSYPAPRRVARGVEYNRLLQILAVLEKRVGLNLSKKDVYVNVIGGIDITEPAADLGIALAILTCERDVVISSDTLIIGEIGLNGEIRPVANIEKRLKEAQKLGFKKAIIPKVSENVSNNLNFSDIEIIQVEKVKDAIVKSLG
ncbi:MAG: DNA repair protein RadA [Cyanobacteria bacterium SIG30]|nr:DNA repair protein RadA [Cyanobacteria bacterium SIG30]